MSEIPKRTVEAANAELFNQVRWLDINPYVPAALAAAMDPALGPDRLVVAGPHEQEVIAKVIRWLRTSDAREGNDAALAHGALNSDHIADMIFDEFGPPSEFEGIEDDYR